MSLREHLLNALRSIKANKLRTILSSLGIIIGVSSVIILLAFGEWTQRSITSSISALWTNLLAISPWGAKQTNVRNTTQTRSSTNVFTMLDIVDLSWFENISAIAPQVNGNRQIIFWSNNISASVYGVTPSYLSVRNSKVQYWDFITDDDVKNWSMNAAIGTDVVTNLFNGTNPLGQKIRVGNTFFTVVWVMESKGWNGFSNADNTIFIPLTTAQNRIFGTQYLSQIWLTVDNADAISGTKASLTTYLLNRFNIQDPNNANFSIISSADTLSTITSVTWTLKAFLWGIAAISLIVWWIGVMNIMLVSVSERTREIWIRRAIWALNRDIILQFLTESVLLTLLWGIIGILFSVLVVSIMQKVWISAYITLYVVLLSFSCAVSVWIIFWLLPASKAAKLKPIDALRSD